MDRVTSWTICVPQPLIMSTVEDEKVNYHIVILLVATCLTLVDFSVGREGWPEVVMIPDDDHRHQLRGGVNTCSW